MDLYCVQLNNGYPRNVVGFEAAKAFGYMLIKNELEHHLKNLKEDLDKITEKSFSDKIILHQIELRICPTDILKQTDSFQLIDIVEKESK